MKPHDAKRRILAEWLHKADSDLGVAEHLLAKDVGYPNAVTFHSQQAAEKFLKAFLVWRNVDFPKTHDLAELLDLIQRFQPVPAESLRDVIALTPYGAEIRYPGDRPDASADEAREAVALAQAVRKAVYAALPQS